MNPDAYSQLPDVFKGRHKIAVLAPHPDDESLGCGLLLSRAFHGAGAHVICLTDGSASHPASIKWPGERLARQRRDELACAIKHLGGSERDIDWLGLTDSKLYEADTNHVAGELAELIERVGARHIFVPSPEDQHTDHKVTARFAQKVRALRPDWFFYSYPVWSRWDDPEFDRNVGRFAPQFLEAGTFAASKSAAVHAHRSQLGLVVADDPDGFVLPAEFIKKFLSEDEVFWVMS